MVLMISRHKFTLILTLFASVARLWPSEIMDRSVTKLKKLAFITPSFCLKDTVHTTTQEQVYDRFSCFVRAQKDTSFWQPWLAVSCHSSPVTLQIGRGHSCRVDCLWHSKSSQHCDCSIWHGVALSLAYCDQFERLKRTFTSHLYYSEGGDHWCHQSPDILCCIL